MWRPDGVIVEFFPSPYTMKPQGTLKGPFKEPKNEPQMHPERNLEGT